MRTPTIDAAGQQLLLQLAADTIRNGLGSVQSEAPDTADFPAPLRQPAAAFVTLKLAGELRGCIGSLEAREPLAEAVASAAHGAAFRDPRFPPLNSDEFNRLSMEISVLGDPEALAVDSEAAAIELLRPGLDGVILEAGKQRATFLPAVWEQLPEPRQFLQQLKHKAGLGHDSWQSHWRLYRYTCQHFCAGNVNEASSTH